MNWIQANRHKHKDQPITRSEQRAALENFLQVYKRYETNGHLGTVQTEMRKAEDRLLRTGYRLEWSKHHTRVERIIKAEVSVETLAWGDTWADYLNGKASEAAVVSAWQHLVACNAQVFRQMVHADEVAFHNLPEWQPSADAWAAIR